jgi:hypothetical protein
MRRLPMPAARADFASGLFSEPAAGRLCRALRRLVCRHALNAIFVRLRFLVFLFAFLSFRHGNPLGLRDEHVFWSLVCFQGAPILGRSRAIWRN